MTSLTVDLIRGVANLGGVEYPMFCGFLSASKLSEVAEVPSFTKEKPHHQIATTIATPPVDEWQRPLDPKKVDSVRQTYNQVAAGEANLMANPILLGVASLNVDRSSNVTITPKSVATPNGAAAVDGFSVLSITYTTGKKPLWILDGQHRVAGLRDSVQRDEPVPFVLLAKEGLYTPPFLAKVFTYVTTRATPMEPLHAEWMKYAFGLPPYDSETFGKSMRVAIELCRQVTLEGEQNPLQNKIRFNPYLPSTGYHGFVFDCSQWVATIANYYYGRGGKLEPLRVAEEIGKALRALELLDAHKGSNSKLFSDNSPHIILAEAFLAGLCKFLVDQKQRTKAEWEALFRDKKRAFDRCDWSLPFVRSTGALSSAFGEPSKTIARECFDAAMSDPDALGGTVLTDFLNGVGAAIRVSAYQKTAAGRASGRNHCEAKFSPGGLAPFHLDQEGIRRDFVKIEAATLNCHVLTVEDRHFNPARALNAAMTRSGLDVSSLPNHYEVTVVTMSYSGDTRKETGVRLDR